MPYLFWSFVVPAAAAGFAKDTLIIPAARSMGVEVRTMLRGLTISIRSGGCGIRTLIITTITTSIITIRIQAITTSIIIVPATHIHSIITIINIFNQLVDNKFIKSVYIKYIIILYTLFINI